MERETGIEPATNSLEGCDSTTELLPPTRSPATPPGFGGQALYALAPRASTGNHSSRLAGPSQRVPTNLHQPRAQPVLSAVHCATTRRAISAARRNVVALRPEDSGGEPSPPTFHQNLAPTFLSANLFERVARRKVGGEGRVRTSVGRSRQVYSLLRLTTLPPPPVVTEGLLRDQDSGRSRIPHT